MRTLLCGFSILVLALAFGCPLAAAEMSHGGMDMHHGTDEMLAPLRDLAGREFERAFYSMMIPHHEGAVRMSEKILGIASTEKVGKWAQDIIAAQRREIGEMRAALDKLGGVERHFHDMMDADMEKMVEGTTDDRSYVELMIPHHESAVRMAEMAKGRTDDKELLRLADDIVRTQNEEIAAFREWLRGTQ